MDILYLPNLSEFRDTAPLTSFSLLNLWTYLAMEMVEKRVTPLMGSITSSKIKTLIRLATRNSGNEPALLPRKDSSWGGTQKPEPTRKRKWAWNLVCFSSSFFQHEFVLFINPRHTFWINLASVSILRLQKLTAYVIRVKQFFICKNLVFGPHFGQNSYKIVLIIRSFPFIKTLKSHVFKSYVFVRKRALWLANHVCKNRFTSNSKPQQRSSLPSFIVCSAFASTIQLENLSQWSYRGWKRFFLVKMLDALENGMK